jgi:hypothetical protein
MNTVQKAYIKAKVIYEMTDSRMNQLEVAFLVNHGRSEKHIWAITDDDSVFDRLNNEFSDTHKSEETVLVKARMDLRQAENDLIAYALSIIPSEDADILRSSKDITVRQKIVDLAISLDTRTVPKHTA